MGYRLGKEVAAASHSGSSTDGSGKNERIPWESLEAVRKRIEGEAVVSSRYEGRGLNNSPAGKMFRGGGVCQS